MEEIFRWNNPQMGFDWFRCSRRIS